jgi:hypothetical protein
LPTDSPIHSAAPRQRLTLALRKRDRRLSPRKRSIAFESPDERKIHELRGKPTKLLAVTIVERFHTNNIKVNYIGFDAQ